MGKGSVVHYRYGYVGAMRNQDLTISYWLVSSRPLFRKALFALFILFDLMLVVLSLFLWLGYASSAGDHERLIASLVENRVLYSASFQRNAPPDLEVRETAVLARTDGDYDFAAMVTNPSDRWALESAAFTFLVDGQPVAEGTANFFPSEERYLVSFRNVLARINPRAQLDLRFADHRWRRVLSSDDIPTVDLAVDNAAYRILSSIPGEQLSQVTATLTNRSVIDLDEVEVTALLLNGATIVGAGQLLLDDVATLEERPVDIRFFQVVAASNVLLHPAVNLATLLE